MANLKLRFLKDCQGCQREFECSIFCDENGNEHGRCEKCRSKRLKQIKHVCEQCGKRASFNFSGKISALDAVFTS